MASRTITQTSKRSGFQQLLSLRSESKQLLRTDFMRFVAAMGIFACHGLEFTVPEASRAAMNARTAGLSFFVEFFFVISGFVIAWVYADRMHTPADFGRYLQRRVGRLWPLHLATLAIAAAFWFAVRMAGIPAADEVDLSVSCLVRTTLLLHAIAPCAGIVPNGQSWSIGAEMVAYVLFPVFVLLALRGGAKGLFVAIAAASGFLIVACLNVYHAPGLPVRHWWSFDNTMILRVIPTFLIGVLCFRFRAHLARVPGSGWAALAIVFVFLVACALAAPAWIVLLLAIAMAIAVLAADQRGEADGVIARLAPLGQLTYGVYMIHGIVLLVLVNAGGDKALHLPPPLLSVLLVVAALVTVGLALLSLKLFETPARRYIDGLPLFRATAAPGRPQ